MNGPSEPDVQATGTGEHQSQRLALGIFVRVPVEGQVKTRLAGAIGQTAACQLYRAFVADTLNTAQKISNCELALFVAGDMAAPEFAPLHQTGLPCVAQYPGSLGERMVEALRWARQRARLTAIIGTDIPTLTPASLEHARTTLAHCDVVFGPAADGGFYLVGAKGPTLPPLADTTIRYSSSHALRDARNVCRAAGLLSLAIEPWYDVDGPDDLRLLTLALSLRRNQAPHTAASLEALGLWRAPQ